MLVEIEAVREKRSREHECVWSHTRRVTGGARVREVHVYEVHVYERREARARSGRAVVDVHKGKSRLPFLFSFLFWVLCK